jgi:hypothetical protein
MYVERVRKYGAEEIFCNLVGSTNRRMNKTTLGCTLRLAPVATYYSGDKIKEEGMGGACGNWQVEMFM